MKVLILGGVPASGKSSMMLEVIKRLGKKEKGVPFARNGVKGLLFAKQKILILGSYEREDFPGTDTLAMNIQPKVVALLQAMKDDDISVCCEGDRLFNAGFIQSVKNMGVVYQIIILEVAAEIVSLRRNKRAKEQNAVWLKGRASKVANIQRDPRFFIKTISNDSFKQLESGVSMILDFCAKRQQHYTRCCCISNFIK